MKLKSGKCYSITLAGSNGLYIREEILWEDDDRLSFIEAHWTEQYGTSMTVIFICEVEPGEF